MKNRIIITVVCLAMAVTSSAIASDDQAFKEKNMIVEEITNHEHIPENNPKSEIILDTKHETEDLVDVELSQERCSDPIEEKEPEKISLGIFKLTAYCPCAICCGDYVNNRPLDANGNEIVYGSTGKVLVQGKSIAVDLSVIPYNTKVIIDGHEYIAHDTGGAIKGNRIDVYFESHQEALDFGVQYAEVFEMTN